MLVDGPRRRTKVTVPGVVAWNTRKLHLLICNNLLSAYIPCNVERHPGGHDLVERRSVDGVAIGSSANWSGVSGGEAGEERSDKCNGREMHLRYMPSFDQSCGNQDV